MTKQTSKPATKQPRRTASEAHPPETSPTTEKGDTTSAATASAVPAPSQAAPSKTAVILGLLTRIEGATLEQMIQVTGWLPHTTRAALTGLKKKGFEVTSEKLDGVRTYRVAMGKEQ